MLYLYDLLKLLHIISAALLLASFAYSVWLWLIFNKTALARISTQTLAIIIPLAIFQSTTGFTLISLKRADLSARWIAECSFSFIIAMVAWFAFIYFLSFTASSAILKKIQSLLLSFCAISLFTLIFLMVNKPTGAST
jgi:hypothetical protein